MRTIVILLLTITITLTKAQHPNEIPDQTCEDLLPNCDHKECPLRVDYMSKNCKKTCEMCGKENSNFDTYAICNWWREHGYCDPSETYYCKETVKKCQYSCNHDPETWCKRHIPVPKGCTDVFPGKCEALGFKQCPYKHFYMTQNCKKTCKMCGENNANFDRNSLCNYWREEGHCDPTSEYCTGVLEECPYTCNHDPKTWCQTDGKNGNDIKDL